MGFWSSVAGIFGRSTRAAIAAGDVAAAGGVIGSSASWSTAPRRGTRELIALYREAPWLRAVTSRIARGVAGAQWHLYVRTDEPLTTNGRAVPAFRFGVDRPIADMHLAYGDDRARRARREQLRADGLLREVVDHPLLRLLARPNDELTGRASLQVSQAWLDIKGEAFWLLRRDKLGVPVGYLPLPPHWVQETPRQDWPNFRISSGAFQVVVPRGDMMWLRDPDPSNPYGRGTGVAESLGDELETDEFAAKYLKNWFFNSAVPGFMVSFKGATEQQLKLAKEKWDRDFRGASNAHRGYFAAGEMNFARLDASFREQQISELRRLQRDTVAQVFNVPPETIGIIENSNRSTIDAADFILYDGVVYPRQEFLRCEIQHQLVPQYDERLVLECERMPPRDAGRDLDVMRAQPSAFDLNEWRAEAGYRPLPAFDGVFVGQPGQLPAGETPAPAPVEPDADDETDGESETEGEKQLALVSDRSSDPPWAVRRR